MTSNTQHATRNTQYAIRNTQRITDITRHHRKTFEDPHNSLRQIPHRQATLQQRYYVPGQDCIYFDFVFNNP